MSYRLASLIREREKLRVLIMGHIRIPPSFRPETTCDNATLQILSQHILSSAALHLRGREGRGWAAWGTQRGKGGAEDVD